MGDALLSTSFRAGLAAVLFACGLFTFGGCSANDAAPGGSGGATAGTGGGTAGAPGSGGAIPSQGSGGSNAGAGSDAGATGGAPAAGGTGGASGTGGSASLDASVSADVGPAGPHGANIALKKTATASSIEHVGREPELICDGDQVTRWVGGKAVYPQWNAVDLQTAHNVDTVVIYPYMARAYQFLLEGSLDGMTYFTLSDKRDNMVGGLTITVSFAAQQARFVRITVSGCSGYAAGWTAINELEIYEAR